jgi:hypothetical protein
VESVGYVILYVRDVDMSTAFYQVKGDLERELGGWILDCHVCNRRVLWVAGIGVRPGHWAHAEPAPDHRPSV